MKSKLLQKNISKFLIPDILFIIFICGFLGPKISFFKFVISISDILAILFCIIFIITGKLKKKTYGIFKIEFLIGVFYIFLYLINFGFADKIDGYSFFFVFRIFTYVMASLFMLNYLSVYKRNKIIKYSILVIFIYIFFYSIFILINVWSYSLDSILYGYTKIRLKLLFEYSNTTSVPLGYILSIIFTYILYSKKKIFKTEKFLLFVYFLAQVFTISRSAILSSGAAIILKKNYINLIIIPLVFFLIAYKTLNYSSENILDKSSFDRVKFLLHSFNFYFQNFPSNFFGYGLSPDIVYLNTGYYYYENIFSQSLISGGILLLLLIFLLKFLFAYRVIFKYQYIYIPVIIGNIFGGFNLFSTLVLPIYFLLIYDFKYPKE